MLKMTYDQYDEMFEIFKMVNESRTIKPEDISYPSVQQTEEYLQSGLNDNAIHYLLWLSSVLPDPKTEDERTVHKMISKALIQNVELVDSLKSKNSQSSEVKR